jgi:hypothetical protein
MEVETSYTIPTALEKLLTNSEIRELNNSHTSTYNLEFDFQESQLDFDSFKNLYEYELPNDGNIFFMFKNERFRYADMININKVGGSALYEVFVTFSHETWPYPINLKHFVTEFITQCIKKNLDISIELSEQYGFYLKMYFSTNSEQTIDSTIEQVSQYCTDITEQILNSNTFAYEFAKARKEQNIPLESN